MHCIAPHALQPDQKVVESLLTNCEAGELAAVQRMVEQHGAGIINTVTPGAAVGQWDHYPAHATPLRCCGGRAPATGIMAAGAWCVGAWQGATLLHECRQASS